MKVATKTDYWYEHTSNDKYPDYCKETFKDLDEWFNNKFESVNVKEVKDIVFNMGGGRVGVSRMVLYEKE